MIAYIKGTLVKIDENAVVVDVNGVGYEIICPNPFVFQSSLNDEVLISTYHYVREDAQLLYGFRDDDEKMLFINLISVSGIGPKGALSILGSVDTIALITAIEQDDDQFLTSLPGIGKKTARQIILDLKGKLSTAVTIPAGSEKEMQANEPTEELQEAQEALKSLGYTEREIKAVLPQLKKQDNSGTDEIIRSALALLMKNK
ncbi:Holliday junction DNA helicase subunit RuvA [Lentibacillus persicus]|uniref:Holliday junction branch migration complex subunit RuvA n=1 Tax=Lentibacillus persicus TaxID=640948 RepID=A0A1I1TMN1_9BACI|nr:Holliday junction branch migration protein RuvA [Lentibacillus persicus]SFD57723.1 Holliday junction DNA helicase subunit RuvA [Lentibacillus persicus]